MIKFKCVLEYIFGDHVPFLKATVPNINNKLISLHPYMKLNIIVDPFKKFDF